MMSDDPRPDLYISADVETDGPVPGPFSMLAFGLVAVGTFDGRNLVSLAGEQPTFYRELRPISHEYQAEALRVNRLDRARLVIEGADPSTAMSAAREWVLQLANDYRPVLVAYPVAFDWAFLYWYFEQFSAGGSPFGHSSCLDIRTLYHALTGTVFDRSSKEHMPTWLLPSSPHTHNALDDAIEQGELFANVLRWAITQRAAVAGKLERPDSDLPSWMAGRLLRLA
jgi:hypothetical protein